MPAFGTVRRRRCGLLRLPLAVAVHSAHGDDMVALGGLPLEDPLDPAVLALHRSETSRLPLALVHLDLDRADPTMRSPGDAGDGGGSGRQTALLARDVDPAHGLDRGFA